jgi:hypothetical protein
MVVKMAAGAAPGKAPSAAERLRPQLPRPEDAQHRHVASIGISARIGVYDIDNPMPLGRHLPRAWQIAPRIEAWMVAKALYGAQNGLDAALRGGTGAGLELPVPDCGHVGGRLN